MQVSSGAASSRDGPRCAAGGAQDSLGAPAAPGLKKPVQVSGNLSERTFGGVMYLSRLGVRSA
eukprot:4894922-Pyramimonas_sp.AAC.1